MHLWIVFLPFVINFLICQIRALLILNIAPFNSPRKPYNVMYYNSFVGKKYKELEIIRQWHWILTYLHN
ncbi:hypothetical protein MNV_1330012 [Candidatus Methanoperedens nitroreducens]|uniref:Uncharacterized protein n=1 Tax=Candidatus Methanoperedens nitratireducens TaxID=1392998 RepID=A0A284VKJ2_9EURY|nr:hypothetical protein MNV_1330012 [Candidatus Methanoperedens nitroreducens]